MKRHARTAYNALQRLDTDEARNVHLINHGDPNNQWNAHFLIGCEPRGNGDEPVGDYYQEYIREHRDANGKIQNAFGIRTAIHDILDSHNLFAEWINPGLLGIYDR